MKTTILKIELATDNAAFEDDRGAECARILRGLADRLEAGNFPSGSGAWGLFDANGNAVGNAGRVQRRC